ncbi:hypothetical protein C5167_042032 [Papaver somniferum]|nr:hypothetical protein C5167_042032 [Papaver somniferum]
MEFKTMIIREGFLVNRELISKITKIPLGNVRLPRTSDKRPSYEDISHGVCGKKVAWNEGKEEDGMVLEPAVVHIEDNSKMYTTCSGKSVTDQS